MGLLSHALKKSVDIVYLSLVPLPASGNPTLTH
jgi:hypothetical protein